MKTIILHIGRHKSGTSSLQAFLSDNQQALKDINVLYPVTGRGNKQAHHGLADALNRPNPESKRYQRLKRRLNKESEGFDTIVISSEAFQNCRNLTLLKQFFSGYRLHVIVYFREILDYLQSAYAQNVQNTNESRDFLTYAEQTKLNYQNFYDRWAHIADDISAHYFQRQALINNDIIDDFLNVTGLDIKILDAPAGHFKRLESEANPSIGGNLLYFKLRYNQLDQPSSPTLYRKLSHIAAENKEEFANGFAIDSSDANHIRTLNKHNNIFIKNLTGRLDLRNFENKPACPDISLLTEDVSRILSHLPMIKLASTDILKDIQRQ